MTLKEWLLILGYLLISVEAQKTGSASYNFLVFWVSRKCKTQDERVDLEKPCSHQMDIALMATSSEEYWICPSPSSNTDDGHGSTVSDSNITVGEPPNTLIMKGFFSHLFHCTIEHGSRRRKSRTFFLFYSCFSPNPMCTQAFNSINQPATILLLSIYLVA